MRIAPAELTRGVPLGPQGAWFGFWHTGIPARANAIRFSLVRAPAWPPSHCYPQAPRIGTGTMPPRTLSPLQPDGPPYLRQPAGEPPEQPPWALWVAETGQSPLTWPGTRHCTSRSALPAQRCCPRAEGDGPSEDCLGFSSEPSYTETVSLAWQSRWHATAGGDWKHAPRAFTSNAGACHPDCRSEVSANPYG